ncbi:hypothetical protein PV10_08562 [Exophiala mesophila]|uniref:DNA replication ATP-dependent helicase/nuclease n=1 Tax=Exophiala mesophila TaxID=212818 RepID=A0A0D1XL79_EXOME|nr:uncharacterized protein PV10_08562 [Exophiala mesophila]KIV88936.1 hypothetical protein PV10_08562 [Exophiala mesophila]
MPPAPLATISSQSKRKLNAFKFDQTLMEAEGNKENQNHLSEDHAPVKHHIESPPRAKPSQNTLPHTPAVKIPIEDLIANTEDAFNCPPPLATPKDHVLWQTNPDSSDPSSSARGTQQSRKRAHSSSPASSQLGRSEHLSGRKEALNLDTLQKSLRTPNNDPTQDLWNRYSAVNNPRSKPGEPILPAYAHLLPSSPQTPGTTGKEASLRRTHSCGTEWPASNAKRRKVDTSEGPQGRTKEIFAASRKDILRHDLSNNTKVGLLLEKIHESLSKKQRVEEGPSSSSPLPERRSQFLESPTRPQVRPQPSLMPAPSEAVQPRASPLRETRVREKTPASSDYGDDELDLEAFECIESAVAQQAEAVEDNRTVVSIDNKKDSNSQRTSCHVHQVEKPRHDPRKQISNPPLQPKPPTVILDDEFDDDDDDDDMMNGMIDLVSKFESQCPAKACGTAEPTTQAPSRLETLDEFDEAFDDDDDMWDSIIDAGHNQTDPVRINPSQQYSKSAQNTLIDHRAIKRYLIVEVVESEYEAKSGRRRIEKMLSVKDEKSGMRYIVLLRDSWYDTRCTKGSYVHIIGIFDNTGTCIIDDASNMIIVHPDHLISSTVVGDSFTCMRRAVLQDRIKATSIATAPQVYGHILHEVFGQALLLDRWDAQSFRDIVNNILPSYLESLYEIGVSVHDATEYLLGKTPELIAWANVFVGQKVSKDSVIRDRNGLLVPTSINKVLELEEHIWSPMYGLKGNIDATVQAQMILPGEASPRTLVIPFELKTGKKDNVEQHRVQTALYTLLLTDRYDINVTCGVLYYMETSKTFRVEGIRNELRHMVIQRNELACYVHDKLALPPMIKKEHLCKTCYSKAACFTYHKLSENGDGVTSGLGEKFNEVVGHLSPEDQKFFEKWDELLTKEERDTMKFRRELWTMLSSEREAVGRCFSQVMILPGSTVENHESSKINRFEYTFVKHKAKPGFSFTESQITIGEPIVISDERGHFNFAAGYVTNVRPNRVTVTVDRRLQYARRRKDGFDSERNQTFTGTLGNGTQGSSQQHDEGTPLLYRIDKDEFANGMATARNNLLRIMEKDLWRARELRQLIIDQKAPEYKVNSTSYSLGGPASQQELNIDQRKAIENVMSAKDYALVLGMPGTGKTTTIAHIIRALVSQGKSVLLASYTHTAVDNILLKIKDDDFSIFRIGAINKVHPEVKSFADISGLQKRTIEELHEAWQGSQVVATTCLSVNHGIFNARTFDYCIVDEASQITLPVCLGPIRMARTFILVGDHYQLPPLVQNKDAQQGGLDVSLFKLLSDAQPDSVVNLEHQYRMAEDIMLLSKELVYSGRIKCGNEAVAKRTLHIPHLDTGLTAYHFTSSSLSGRGSAQQPTTICASDGSCWLRKALCPTSRCLLLNTDSINPAGSAKETASGPRITNTTECTLTAQLVAALIHCGIAPKSIGVITFYRSQLALLRTEVKSTAGSVAASEVEMHTADKYQGRDKEVVILSCVRSNDHNHVGDLLKDWRRVNVAVTRARSKLLILGSKSTLEGSDVPILQGLTKLMDAQGWIMDLPAFATTCHTFETIMPTTGATQVSTVGDKGQIAPTPANNQSRAVKRPLDRSNGNTSTSPRKIASSTGVHAPFKMPKKVVHGSKIVDLEKLLDQRPVMRDVMNDIVGQENVPTIQQAQNKSQGFDVDMDDDFDPAAFGIFE